MSELEKLKIEYAKLQGLHERLQGQFLGLLEGLEWWELPPDLRKRLNAKKKELIEKFGD